MLNPKLNARPLSYTATHATLAVATTTVNADLRPIISTVSVSSDKAGSILLIKDDTTVIWQTQVGVGNLTFSFPEGLFGTRGETISVEIDGTAACKANMTVVMEQFFD